MPTAGTPGAATRSTTRFSELAARYCQSERNSSLFLRCATNSDALFLGEIGFRFGELRPIGTRATDLRKFGVVRLRSARVAGCFR